MTTREERIEVLKGHIPFLNPIYMPIVEERLETKAKFSQLQDRLLLMMLHSNNKDLARLRLIYLPSRNENQIRNRIKNLSLSSKDTPSPIKDFKVKEVAYLNEQELNMLCQAMARYGTRWSVISRYYCLRTPWLLEDDYAGCPKLYKKRNKQPWSLNSKLPPMTANYQLNCPQRPIESSEDDHPETKNKKSIVVPKDINSDLERIHRNDSSENKELTPKSNQRSDGMLQSSIKSKEYTSLRDQVDKLMVQHDCNPFEQGDNRQSSQDSMSQQGFDESEQFHKHRQYQETTHQPQYKVIDNMIYLIDHI